MLHRLQRLAVLLLVVALYLLPTQPASAAQVTYQPGSTEGKDMWWSSYYSYGSPYHVIDDGKLQVGGWGDSYYTFIQFNLSCLPQVADSAYLYLRAYPRGDSSTPVPMKIYVMTTDWTETQGSSGTVYGIYQYTTGTPIPGQWLKLNITGIYNYWKSGTFANKGLILTPTETNNRFNVFYSSDYPTQSLRPYLEINYTPSIQPFKICFPLRLPDYEPYTAPITSVFDHKMGNAFSTDGIVTAYTGEQGDYQPYPDDSTCINQQGGGAFSVGGQYKGASECGGRYYLSYDGHPGIDYPAAVGTPVYATADGEIVTAECPSKSSGLSCAGRGTGFGKLIIDHGNGYSTSYNHLSATADGLGVTSMVKKGQLVGYSGQTSPTPIGPHLHLSILRNGVYVDPYGWTGSGTDPYLALHGGIQNLEIWEKH